MLDIENNIKIEKNSRFRLNDKIYINDNMLITENNKYEINIDAGTAFIHGNQYEIRLESSNVFIKNRIYMFGIHIFNISNDLVRCAEEVYHLNNFALKVQMGRIKIKKVYYLFTFENGIFHIGTMSVHDNLSATEFFDLGGYTHPHIYNGTGIKFPDKKTPPPVLKKLADDRQNVHDGYILDKLKYILIELSEKTIITKTIKDTIYEIKKYNFYKEHNTIENKVKKNKKKKCIKYYWDLLFNNNKRKDNDKPVYYINNDRYKAYFDDGVESYYLENCKANKIVSFIKNNNGYHTSYQMTELEVLQLVWNAIGNNNDLKEILYHNLLDMNLSRDSFNESSFNCVCLTGRIARIIDIFSGIKINLSIDKDTIKNEMLSKCAIIRKDLHVDIINNDKLYKKEIRRQLYKDYVDSKILSNDEFNEEVNKWIEYIN